MKAVPAQVGGTRGFLPAVEGMRACAAMGVVLTHVAFQTGTSGGVIGRLLHRFDLAVAVFFALSGFLPWRGMHRPPAVCATVRRPATTTVEAGPDPAGLSGRGRGDPDAAAGGQPRQPNGVVGEPDPHPGLRTADPDSRVDSDVESVGGGQLLPRATDPRFSGLPAAGAGPCSGDRRGGGGEPGWGLLPIHAGVRELLNWPPAYASWFGAGMLLAEWTVSPVGWPHRLA